MIEIKHVHLYRKREIKYRFSRVKCHVARGTGASHVLQLNLPAVEVKRMADCIDVSLPNVTSPCVCIYIFLLVHLENQGSGGMWQMPREFETINIGCCEQEQQVHTK